MVFLFPCLSDKVAHATRLPQKNELIGVHLDAITLLMNQTYRTKASFVLYNYEGRMSLSSFNQKITIHAVHNPMIIFRIIEGRK